MTKKYSVNSYILLIVSGILMGLGITVVTKANIGTTAFTALPFVVSNIVNVSFGTMTGVFNLVLIFIQLIIMRQQFPAVQYLQFLVAVILGYAVDFWGWVLSTVTIQNYLIQLLMVVVGCFIIAVSIRLQLKADIVNNPSEGIVKAIAWRSGQLFSKIKLRFDIILVIFAVTISLIVLNTLVGVREGTLLSAFLVGMFLQWIEKIESKQVKETVQ